MEFQQSQNFNNFVSVVGPPPSMRMEVRTDVPALTVKMPRRFLAQARCQHQYPPRSAPTSCSAWQAAVGGCSWLLSADGWYMTWCPGYDPRPSRWLVPGLERARVQRTRPCELARGAHGASSISTDSVRRRVLPLRGWRARIDCTGRTASFGAGSSAPPRWPGLVEWHR